VRAITVEQAAHKQFDQRRVLWLVQHAYAAKPNAHGTQHLNLVISARAAIPALQSNVASNAQLAVQQKQCPQHNTHNWAGGVEKHRLIQDRTAAEQLRRR
jgi:hypothetical protein